MPRRRARARMLRKLCLTRVPFMNIYKAPCHVVTIQSQMWRKQGRELCNQSSPSNLTCPCILWINHNLASQEQVSHHYIEFTTTSLNWSLIHRLFQKAPICQSTISLQDILPIHHGQPVTRSRLVGRPGLMPAAFMMIRIAVFKGRTRFTDSLTDMISHWKPAFITYEPAEDMCWVHSRKNAWGIALWAAGQQGIRKERNGFTDETLVKILGSSPPGTLWWEA